MGQPLRPDIIDLRTGNVGPSGLLMGPRPGHGGEERRIPSAERGRARSDSRKQPQCAHNKRYGPDYLARKIPIAPWSKWVTSRKNAAAPNKEAHRTLTGAIS